MCNLYSITTNQAAIAGLFRRMNRYVGNLPPMPGVFPDYPAPVIRNFGDAEEMVLMRWGMPPPPPGRSAAAVKSSDCKTCEDNAVESAPSVGNGVTV
jgi:putative SOS response-associated peptidase YedK